MIDEQEGRMIPFHGEVSELQVIVSELGYKGQWSESNCYGSTIFEMWLGSLSTYQGLSIPVT